MSSRRISSATFLPGFRASSMRYARRVALSITGQPGWNPDRDRDRARPGRCDATWNLAVCVLTAWMTAYGECHPCGQPAAEPAGIRWYHSCGLVWRASTWCGELQAAGPHDRSSRHAPISPYEHRKPTGHTRPQMATMAEARGVEPWRSGRLREGGAPRRAVPDPQQPSRKVA